MQQRSLRRTIRKAGAAVVAGAVAGVLPILAAPASAAVPTFHSTLVSRSEAAMYPSGLEWDANLDRVIVADTAGDKIQIYSPTGTKIGEFGTYGTADGQVASPRDVAVDPQSNIYVADAENNRVQKFDANGNWQWTVGGIGTGASNLNTPIGVTWDTQNNVLLVASTGQNRIKAFTAAGTFVWQSPATTAIGVRAPRDVARGPDGRIWVSDYGGHTMKAFTVVAPQNQATSWTLDITLGDGLPAGKGDGQLNFPYNVVFNAAGTIAYVSDTGNGRVARWDLTTSPPTWIPQFGQRCSAHPQPCPDPPNAPGLFNHLRRVAVDDDGNIYAADFWGNGIEVFTPTGVPLRSIEGASAPLPGVAEAYGVDVGNDGQIYVMDRNNHRIERFTPEGVFVNAAGARGTQPAVFSWPEALAVAPDGSVWVADTRNDRIHKFPANLATSPVVPRWGTTGTGAGQFNYIEDIAVGPDGIVWIADTRNNRIQRFDPVTQVFTVIGGQGAGPGQFAQPMGVDVSDNFIYVADTLNNRIQKLTLTGEFVAQFNTGLNGPEGVAVAPDGTVWVADTQNNRVLHLSADLVDLGDTFGSAGTGNLQFNRPHTLAVGNNKLYVADTYNDRVQVFNLPSSEPGPDTSPPTGAMTFPTPNATVPSGPLTMTGTTSDDVGVAKVEVAIKDSVTGQWLRANGTWGASFVYIPATIDNPGGATTNWSFAFNPPELRKYGTQARATDTSGKQTVIRTFINFTVAVVDSEAPTGVLTAPTPNSTHPFGPIAITGTATDDTGVAAVELGIRDVKTNLWLRPDGSWLPNYAPVPTTLGTPNSTSTTWSFTFNPPAPNQQYAIQARARDISKPSKVAPFQASFKINVGAAAGPFNPTYLTEISADGGVAPMYPAGGVSDSAGNRYIADSGGSRLLKIDAGGTVTALPAANWNDPRDLDFDDAAQTQLWVANTSANEVVLIDTAGTVVRRFAGFTQPYGLAASPAGLWVADTYANRVVRIDKVTGNVLWSQTTCAGTTFSRPRDVGLGSDGNIYVADTDRHRIVRLDADTGACVGTPFGTNGTANGRFRSPRAVTSDGSGGLWVADAFNYRIQHFLNDGTFVAATNGGFGEGTNQYRSAHCVFVDNAGLVNVCDTFNYRIQRYTVNGAGAPLFDSVLGGTRPTPGGFNGPFATAYGPSGELYVVDWFNHRIQKFNPDGSFAFEFGGYGSADGALIFPRNIMVAPNGELIVTDSENNRIDVFNSSGTFLRSFKPTGISFSRPHQTALAPDGTYYVADTNADRIVHLDGSGTVLHTWDNGATIKKPQGIAVDADGNVYVSNTNPGRIEKYAPDGTFIANLVTAGAAAGKVSRPAGLQIVGTGADARLYVAEQNNNRVSVFRLDGTLVGTFGSAGSGAGQFNTPKSVAVSPVDGRMAIADHANNRVSIWSAG